jgi:hypothetical protein
VVIPVVRLPLRRVYLVVSRKVTFLFRTVGGKVGGDKCIQDSRVFFQRIKFQQEYCACREGKSYSGQIWLSGGKFLITKCRG